MGLDAVSVSSGSEGLMKIRQRTFDLIFIDIDLPDVNGLELLTRIKEISPLSKFIVITAETDEVYRRTAIDEGVTEFFEKPFDFYEIKKLISRIFPDRKEK